MYRYRLFVLVAVLISLAGRAVAAGLPSAVAEADELAALPGGYWLALAKGGLALVDGQGRETDRIAVRAEQLDSRPTPDGALAVVFDEDAEQAMLLRIDLGKGRFAGQRRLPMALFSVESQCLYRDGQQLDHLFLVGEDGEAEQWLLSGPEPRLLRRLALPTGVKHCRADDVGHVLYLSERGFGVWTYPADAEGSPDRSLVVALKPYGPLVDGPGALAVTPAGLALLADGGNRLQLLRERQDAWRAIGALATTKADALLPVADGLLVRERGTWRLHKRSWPAAGRSAPALPVVTALTQSEPVGQSGDAADDPAIWVDPADPAKSLVLATNKKQGLLSYDLQGRQKQFLDVGRVNNVDVRQRVRFSSRTVDIAVATQRDENSLVVFEIDAEGWVRDVGHIATGLKAVYGVCLYQPPEGGLEVFVNDKDGSYLQYALVAAGDGYSGTVQRRFAMSGQAEGCVVDDRSRRLFVAEEDRGVWALSADAHAADRPRMILPVGPHLTADAEGLAIYHGQQASYLIASSQGDSSFAVLDAEPPFAHRGSFRVGINAGIGIDGVSDTDGVEASAVDLGGAYGDGMLIVQDGFKRLPDGPQDFKYIAWRDVALALGLK